MRKGDFIQTFTGIAFYPLDPRVEDIRIEDIARSLSQVCRYNGHTKIHYSVAQHSLIIAEKIWNETKDPVVALQGLLHDASEAYICDIPRPLKPYLTNYKDIEQNLMNVICDRFDLPSTFDPIVKKYDDLILNDERNVLLPACDKEWAIGREMLGVEITKMESYVVEFQFLQFFDFLNSVRKTNTMFAQQDLLYAV